MLYNTMVNEYDDYYHIQIYTKPITKKEVEDVTIREDLEEFHQELLQDDEKSLIKDRSDSLRVSMNRSKNNLYKIARSNKWDLFITLTFDQKKIDSSDYNLVSKKITNFLNNLRKRGSPDLKYLLVPEFHSDGIHYHFHGLLANCPSLKLVDSGHKDFTGEVIYNIVNWSDKIGFTTATKIKDNSKVVNYIGKYITKELMNKLKYKKRYYCSKNVNIAKDRSYNIPENDLLKELCDDISYIKSVSIPLAGQRIKYIEVKKSKKALDFFNNKVIINA